MSEKIVSVYCVTEEGSCGMMVGSGDIKTISIENIIIDGDPFQHYIGRDKEGNMLRSIRMLCPCDVTYSKEV